MAEVANVHGALPDWLLEGREVCARVSHRAAQLLPSADTAALADAPAVMTTGSYDATREG
jgi:hypothetical protein